MARVLRVLLEDICTVTRRVLLKLLITRRIDGTLETEHSRQTEFKTASEK